jgi:outer membrane lipoprotein LolB
MMRGVVFFGLTLLLDGCALLPTAPPPLERPAHFESAPFAMNGRISIDHHGERHSAGLHWTHEMQSDEILLLTPLGQTAARVYRDDSNATLDEGDKHYQDINVEALMQQVLGWHLPLIGLHQWVLGLSTADTPAQISYDSNGRIAVLRQDGWEVHYLRYADPSSDSMPTSLQLSHEDLQVKLLIDGWEWNAQ